MAIAFTRSVVLYLLIVMGLRFMGKRQIGELELSELVLALLIADLAAVPMQDFGIPLLNGLIPIFTLLALTMVISVLSMKSVRIRSFVFGKPSILVEKGRLIREEMRKNRVTIDELCEELRLQGVTDLSTIQYAILETNGKLSVLLFPSKKPASAELQNLKPEDPGLPVIIINDGRLLRNNMQLRALDKNWLDDRLLQYGVSSVDDVFLLSVDESGGTYFIGKEPKP
ncbi:DUF421 domain-containing protein [Papillibacter cinnamivorans]|uniref:Uncharacterized membrane protein YcaP, DUF421 family n=1 Tax=Papillibacter cinnamivorans DSM 12816 TaxID=1122930 RepID=A0A1W1ZAV8_9FIRM|nr:DUF421 domain-containing protein [Papillibacter cinnamivorans]SMC45472.1 Uncharacterized membrane protein YcaP, DUF421 family [Papillibacter cinnamivorans DSM 12816]